MALSLLNAHSYAANSTLILQVLRPRTSTTPNDFQTDTIITASLFFLAVLIAWNMPGLRDAISGLKLFVVATHEISHLIVGLICGGQVVSICIDPNDGGATHILGLMRAFPRIPRDPYAFPSYSQMYWSASALATLAAGYVGSGIVGFLFIFCAFDIVASKAVALVIH
ncbi:MAG: hypothetical protein TREMPRED_003857, partial [Tremellales sp. Tagirdzhanova-0007]